MNSICFVSAFPPNEETAGQKYTLSLLRDLSTDHVVNVVYFTGGSRGPAELGENVTYHPVPFSGWARVLGWLQFPVIHPLFSGRFSWRMLRVVRRMAKSSSMIYFDFAQTFIYRLFISHRNVAFMEHDVVFQSFLRRRSAQRPWVHFSEQALVRLRRQLIFVPSEKDRQLLKTLYGTESISVPQYLDPRAALVTIPSDAEAGSLLFMGAWARPENWDGLVWFVENVARKLEGQVDWKVVGSGLNEAKTEYLRSRGGIVLGFVDNPFQELASARALVAPLFQGAGIKVKVIEALSCGTPVIGTEVAFEGIEDRAGGMMIIARSAQDFIDASLSPSMSVQERENHARLFRNAYFSQGAAAVIRGRLGTARPRSMQHTD